MSDYQYYEFQAIDRPLTKAEMAELRQLSTRATITPTRLVNVYHWGDFRGDPDVLMQTYFDAFLYLANWGTHQLMFRLPRRLLDLETASPYCPGEGASARAAGDRVIEAIARAKYLAELAPREADVWQEVEALIGAMRAAEYDRAVQLLVDLRDLAARAGRAESFGARLRELRLRYPTRSALLRRLDQAGLPT